MSGTSTNIKKITRFYSDPSFWALIASNLIVITWALLEGWSLAILMWVYWSQSAIIGIFWFVKILVLKDFSTKDFKINGQPVDPTKATKIQTAVFFLFHYGFFHVVYSIFLKVEFKFVPTFQLLMAASVFFIYQCYSFFYSRKWETKGKPNIGTMIFFPYARIIPMHITLFIAFSEWGQQRVLALFLFLKMLADVIMHVVERKGFADKER